MAFNSLLIILAACVLFAIPIANADSLPLYIGNFTKTLEQGIGLARFDRQTGQFSFDSIVAMVKNPAFLALHPSGKYLYSIDANAANDDRNVGGVSAFFIDSETGAFTKLNTVGTRHTSCHISIHPNGKFLMSAAYNGGSVEVWSLKENGEIGERVQFIQHPTQTNDEGEEKLPRAHQIVLSPDNSFALVANLGLDKVFTYRFNSKTGELTPTAQGFVTVAPGAGPRHVTWGGDGRFVYVINEHDSTISAFGYEDGVLSPQQTISTLPANFDKDNYTAAIAISPDGKFLYGSNRGRDSIAIFSIDKPSGVLKRIGEEPTRGKFPWDFALAPGGDWLLVANQQSSSVSVFRVDKQSGALTFHALHEGLPGSPVCLLFATAAH